LPHPALISEALSPPSRNMLANGFKISCMKDDEGAGWLSSGVPEIGTKGTTKG
jgi:hypothetical protein